MRSFISKHFFLGLSLALTACDDSGPAEGSADPPEFNQPMHEPALAVGDEGTAVREAYDFLRRHGYFPNPELAAHYPGWSPVIDIEPEDPELFDVTLEEAVALYQQAHGLPVTGTLDGTTQNLMQQPRCGFPDYYRPRPAAAAGRSVAAHSEPWQHGEAPDGGAGSFDALANALDASEYKITPNSWPSLEITYAFTALTMEVDSSFQRKAVIAAMNTWSAAAPVTWVERGNQEVSIAFVPHAHGDGHEFVYGTLAHAFPPCSWVYGSFACDAQAGDLHFNNQSYKWGNGNGNSEDIETVALHELGHVLGLDHSSNSQAIMYAVISGKNRDLSTDDINGIRAIYPSFRDLRTFEPFWYLLLNPDVADFYNWSSFASSFHWISNGRTEGRRASAAFDVRYYLTKNPDVALAYGATNFHAAIWHWRDHGLGEGRRSSPAFHAKFYLDRYADLRDAFGPTNHGAALTHWLQQGIKEGRRASAEFDPVFYLQANPDVANVFGAANYGGALYHWLVAGLKEGRKGAP